MPTPNTQLLLGFKLKERRSLSLRHKLFTINMSDRKSAVFTTACHFSPLHLFQILKCERVKTSNNKNQPLPSRNLGNKKSNTAFIIPNKLGICNLKTEEKKFSLKKTDTTGVTSACYSRLCRHPDLNRNTKELRNLTLVVANPAVLSTLTWCWCIRLSRGRLKVASSKFSIASEGCSAQIER